MPTEDPAITEAKRLWNNKEPASAMQVLMRRINDLNAQGASAGTGFRLGPRVVLAFSLITLAIITTLVIYVYVQASTRSSAEWWTEAEPVTWDFLSTIEIAESTPRASLGAPLTDLNRYRSKFNQIEPPSSDDGRAAHEAILEAMNAEIKSFTMFAADDPDSMVSEQMTAAYTAWVEAEVSVQSLGLEFPAVGE